MGFGSFLKRALGVMGDRKLRTMGILEALCPYCNISLEKKPGRKKKCPGCGNFIYVRKRPIDGERALLREEDLPLLEEQWAIANGTIDEIMAQRREVIQERGRLTKELGSPASDADVQWSLLQRRSVEHAQRNDWGLYRNHLLEMVRHLEQAQQPIAALRKYLEVCYVDLNGPSNCGGMMDPEIRREFPSFDVSLAMLAGGVVACVRDWTEFLELVDSTLHDRFSEVAEPMFRTMNLPRHPTEAWGLLKREIDGLPNV